MGIALHIASVIASLGILAGYIQTRISPEEMKTGAKFFPYLKALIFVIIAVVGFIYKEYEMALIAIATVYFAFRNVPYIDYFTLGLCAALSQGLTQILLPLVFIYGLPAGSLLYQRKRPQIFILANALIFLILFQVLPLLLPNA